jgi:pilus assembly protein CpaF
VSTATVVIGDAYGEIRHEVLTRLDRARLDPDNDPAAVTQLIEDAVRSYQTAAHLGRSPALRDPDEMVARVLRSITGHGPLTELLDRPDVEEIFIEGAQVTYLDGTGQLHALPVPTTEEENRQLVDRLLATTQRHLDAQSPIVQARVLDGTARLTATIPPVADHLSATIRRHILRRETLPSFVDRDSLTAPAAALLDVAMRTTTSIVVSGPPGAGKTSLLAGLLAAAPSHHCIRACEEIRELHVPLAHGAYYEARPAALDGSGEIPLRALVKFVLAMRPDRIVVGEVRGAEAFELTRAVNAGCGFLCTVHANGAKQALSALVNAAIMAGENVTEPIVRKVFASAIDLVVHCDRDDVPRSDGTGIRRQVMEILAVVPSLHDDFTTEPVFVRERLGAPLTWTGAVPEVAARLERALPHGMSIRDLLEGRRAPW